MKKCSLVYNGIFDVVSVKEIPMQLSAQADVLAISTYRFQLGVELLKGHGKIEIFFRPSILDNFKHWHVFSVDSQVLNFFNNLIKFEDFEVEFDMDLCEKEMKEKIQNHIYIDIARKTQIE